MKKKKIIFLIILAANLLFCTFQANAEKVYREKYEGIGPYDGTEQELDVEGTASGYKTIDEFRADEKVTLYAGDGRTLDNNIFYLRMLKHSVQ